MTKRTRERRIQTLRRVHGGTWTWDRLTCRYTHHESGREVRVSAALAPRFDGDDESFAIQMHWADTGERAEWK